MRRLALLDRLRKGGSFPVLSVVAPAGYGKTTLLSQWAERNGQAFAWVSLDERDNDPKVLLTYVAEALDAVEPIDQRVFDALASPGSSVPGSVVPRLGSALASMTSPVALVLDDVHLLHDPGCRAAMPVLADHVPDGSQLVLAGRDAPPLPIARLRAEGRVMEIGPGDLALTLAEAASLLREAGITLGQDDLTELHRRIEGWPAGLYLAALSLREGGSVRNSVASFTGEHHLVSEYIQSEFLARISTRQRVFLTRTAVLERMCGPLCEAVLDAPGAAATLADLARSNVLLVPLDRHGEWYRYHHLFRDMLLAELRRREPELIPVLRRRAAGWCVRNGLPEDALEYSIAADDVDAVAGLAARLIVRTRRQGRVATVQRWLRWLDERGAIEQHLVLAALAGVVSALAGRAAEAERWADAADRRQHGDAARPDDAFAEVWAAVLRALLCRRGVEQMRADADEAVRKCVAAGIAAPPVATVLQGIARVISGDLDDGDTFFEDAVSGGEKAEGPEAVAAALCERSLVAMARDEWTQAEALGRTSTHRGAPGRYRGELRDAPGLRGASPGSPAPGRHPRRAPAARQRSAHAARADRRSASPRRPGKNRAGSRLYRAYRPGRCQDAHGREIDELLRHRPGLGTLRRRGRRAPRPAVQAARSRCPRSVGADRCRAAAAADTRHPPVVPPDRRADVPIPPHRQGGSDLDLPQARGLVAGSGRHEGAGPRPPRPVTGRRSEGSSGRPDIT